MTKDKGIFIRNIYYMLAYAFQVLRQKNYDDVAAEDFDNIQDLFAAILAKGVSQQIKQGLHREYITKNEINKNPSRHSFQNREGFFHCVCLREAIYSS